MNYRAKVKLTAKDCMVPVPERARPNTRHYHFRAYLNTLFQQMREVGLLKKWWILDVL